MVAIVVQPVVSKQYALVHSTGFQQTSAKCSANSFLISRLVTVFRLLINLLGIYWGAYQALNAHDRLFH